MALKMVKGSIDRMFDKNLQDLVRGIRNHKEDEVSPAPRDPPPPAAPTPGLASACSLAAPPRASVHGAPAPAGRRPPRRRPQGPSAAVLTPAPRRVCRVAGWPRFTHLAGGGLPPPPRE